MNILYVVELYYPHIGGVEMLYKNLSERLVKKGHKCTVITTQLQGTKKYELLNGVEIHRVATPSFAQRYWFSFLAIRKAAKMAKDYDVIHTTTYNASLPALIASKWKKTPSVITIHEVFGKNWYRLTRMNKFSAWIHKTVEQLIVWMKFDKVACPSEFTKRCAIERGSIPERISVVHAGVDYKNFNPDNVDLTIREKLGIEDNFVLVSFGRPGLSKGIEYLVQAVPEILKQIPNAKLLLLLADSPRERYDYIVGLIKKLQIQDHIILHKPVPYKELPSYIAAADCGVVPSLSEGFGLTVAESCAMGIPVVASNVGSIPEVINGRHVLVKPKSPLSIAEGVEKVFKKEYTQSSAKLFTWDKAAQNYYKLYEEIVDKKSGEEVVA